MGGVSFPSIRAYPKRKDTVLRQMARPVPIFIGHPKSPAPTSETHATLPACEVPRRSASALGVNRGVLTAVQLILTAIQ